MSSDHGSRLRDLAEAQARDEHDWFFNGSSTMLPPKDKGGHTRHFEDCPHPDCALLRASASAPPENKEQIDEEQEPHKFNSRTRYEPGDDRDIWCADCEYHRDHAIHSQTEIGYRDLMASGGLYPELRDTRTIPQSASASALSPEPAKEQLQREDYAVIAEAVTDFLGFDITTREQQDRITRWAALSPSSSPSARKETD